MWPRRRASLYCWNSGRVTAASVPFGTAARAAQKVGGLPLCVLGCLAGALEAVLLAFLHPRVTGEEAGLTQREAMVRVELEERPGDAVPDRSGLTRDPAALDLDHRVEAAVGIRDLERQANVVLVNGCPEVLEQRSPVHDDL